MLVLSSNCVRMALEEARSSFTCFVSRSIFSVVSLDSLSRCSIKASTYAFKGGGVSVIW